MNPNELYHHGTKGQKWGRRRYQNSDGSLTPLGRIRYGSKNTKNNETQPKGKTTNKPSEEADEQPKRKKASEMTDDELRKATERLRLETSYQNALNDYDRAANGGNNQNSQKAQVAEKGKSGVKAAMKEIGTKAVKRAAEDVATQAAKYAMGTALNKASGKKIINLKDDDNDGGNKKEKKKDKSDKADKSDDSPKDTTETKESKTDKVSTALATKKDNVKKKREWMKKEFWIMDY